MTENQQRLVGAVNPTGRNESRNREASLLPEEIKVITVCAGIQSGTEAEFRQSKGIYEEKVAELAGMKVDMIHVGGAPPMMVHGFKGEEEFVKMLEEKYKTPVYTAGRSQSDAFRALGVRSFLGLTYFPPAMNKIFSDYFTQSGFQVAAMEGLDVPFASVHEVPGDQIAEFAKESFKKHAATVDGIYMLGSGWDVLNIAPVLETELRVPVIYAQAVKIWSVLKHFGIRRPVKGYGRLLQELP
ncbi:MAG: hypothetical protein GTO40_23645 [Deltaproteobacteria bacterium]|nr:hypothetical protein [Deltaproteobacteria bacterium]